MKKNLILAAFGTVLLLTSGCASIVSKSTYPVLIDSDPRGAEFTIENRSGTVVAQGTTPNTVSLEASAGFFSGETYSVRFKKANYGTVHRTIDSSMDPWYVGNLLFGGFIGLLIVDPATGAMWKLPDRSRAYLEPLQYSVVEQSRKTEVEKQSKSAQKK